MELLIKMELSLKQTRPLVPPGRKQDLLQLYREKWGHQDKRHAEAKLKRNFDNKVKINPDTYRSCVYGKAHRL